jgi:hypothetical protein
MWHQYLISSVGYVAPEKYFTPGERAAIIRQAGLARSALADYLQEYYGWSDSDVAFGRHEAAYCLDLANQLDARQKLLDYNAS